MSKGIDIAKRKFDVVRLQNNKPKHKAFPNNPEGFAALIAWLGAFDSTKPLICMESTGAYSIPLAEFLADAGFPVSVVNPAKIKAFAQSELIRAKTDKTDAKLIARYALEKQPPLWTPPPPDVRTLQALLRRVEHLLEMQQMEKNRLDTAHCAQVDSIQTMLARIDQELKSIRQQIHALIDQNPRLKQNADLLRSIPGIGDASMAHLLVLLDEHREFTDAKQVVAFIGLDPRIRESGDWKGKTRISKTGDKLFRKILYMPAMVAMRFNPLIRDFCNRLKANHKPGKVIVCAAMRKLLHIAFAILKSAKPFDPLYTA